MAQAGPDSTAGSASAPDANDPGLLSTGDVGLLIDQYELTMGASYLARGMNEPAVFELSARRLPERRQWLLVAGLGPTLNLIRSLRFGARELEYLAGLGFDDRFLRYLHDFRFSGDIDAMPEGMVAFANEPLLRVAAPLIEAQLLETLLLNQINFQTTLATKAARILLAAGGGRPGAGGRVVDFSARRDHGTDAAMKAARCAVIAGADGTSNVAAAMRYGVTPVGTMAHSYVMSFASERESFRAFLEDFPGHAVLLVDTYDTLGGVRNAIAASLETGVPLAGIRLDSGDLLDLARGARALLDDAGMTATQIVASGNLDEHRIGALVGHGAPIDVWGVGTDLGTSRDAPVLDGVYKLVAEMSGDRWRGVAKRSPGKATVPGAKQVYRRYADGRMVGDVIAMVDEPQPGDLLLAPVVRAGHLVHEESLAELRERAASQLSAIPERLLALDPDEGVTPYPVEWSERLRTAGGGRTSGARVGV